MSAGKKIAVNTGVSTFQNPGGSRALAAQATITVSHGKLSVKVFLIIFFLVLVSKFNHI